MPQLSLSRSKRWSKHFTVINVSIAIAPSPGWMQTGEEIVAECSIHLIICYLNPWKPEPKQPRMSGKRRPDGKLLRSLRCSLENMSMLHQRLGLRGSKDLGPCWFGLTDCSMQRSAAQHLEVPVTSEGDWLSSPVRSEDLWPKTSAATLLTQLTGDEIANRHHTTAQVLLRHVPWYSGPDGSHFRSWTSN